MTHKERELLILRMHNEIWNQGKLECIEELYSKDFIGHYPGNEWKGIDGIKRAITEIRNSFPDWCEEVKDIIVSDDKVVSRFVSKGTHNGNSLGIEPTGNIVEIDEIAIFRIENGKIAEQWGVFDSYKMMDQIGAIKG